MSSHLDEIVILLVDIILSDNDGKWLITGLMDELANFFTACRLATGVLQVVDIPLLISDNNQDTPKRKALKFGLNRKRANLSSSPKNLLSFLLL